MTKSIKLEISEFDQYAESYYTQHAQNINLSGETPDYFSAYKIRDVKNKLRNISFRDKLIVDFGCGIGNSVPHLTENFPDSRFVFVDVSNKSLDIAKARFPSIIDNCLLITHDKINLPDDSVDMVFTACVFHHINHASHAYWLTELRRIVKPGGYLFIFEHNPYNLLTLHAVNTCPFDVNAKLISAPKMKSYLLKAGWKNARINYRIFFPKILAKLRILEKYMVKIPFGAQYYIMANK